MQPCGFKALLRLQPERCMDADAASDLVENNLDLQR
jgi:hypothetical protein